MHIILNNIVQCMYTVLLSRQTLLPPRHIEVAVSRDFLALFYFINLAHLGP